MFACIIVMKDSAEEKKGLFTYNVQSGVLCEIHISNLPTVWKLMRVEELSVILSFQRVQDRKASVSVLHNRSLGVIAEMEWMITGRQNAFAVDHERGSFLEVDQSEGSLNLRVFRLGFAQKDQFMHLMLDLDENMDEDLLQETLTLLQQI